MRRKTGKKKRKELVVLAISELFLKKDEDGCVEKFYHMTDQEDGTFRVSYGTIGVFACEKVYEMNRWDQKYRERLKNGYEICDDSDFDSFYLNHTLAKLNLFNGNYVLIETNNEEGIFAKIVERKRLGTERRREIRIEEINEDFLQYVLDAEINSSLMKKVKEKKELLGLIKEKVSKKGSIKVSFKY
jgi:hypothetical protein